MVANASEGGLLVYLPERMEIGAFLKIEIFYVRGLELDTIKAVAKVVWCDLAARESWGEHRYGLQFQYIDQKDLSRLTILLKEVGIKEMTAVGNISFLKDIEPDKKYLELF